MREDSAATITTLSHTEGHHERLRNASTLVCLFDREIKSERSKMIMKQQHQQQREKAVSCLNFINDSNKTVNARATIEIYMSNVKDD